MFEIEFTIKSICAYLIGIMIFIDALLTGYLVVHGLSFIGSLLFCTPISIGLVAVLAVVGGILFHVHKKLN